MLFAVKNATSSMNPNALFVAEKNSHQSIKLLLLIVKFTRINNIHLYQIIAQFAEKKLQTKIKEDLLIIAISLARRLLNVLQCVEKRDRSRFIKI
jgi:sensor domain CHASE-containing protein